MGSAKIMFARTAQRCFQTAPRRMCTTVEKAATGGGEIQAWRPKIQVTRHLSPHQMPIVTPASKWFLAQKNAVIENSPDWIPGVFFFFSIMYVGNHYHGIWAREHAMHAPDDD